MGDRYRSSQPAHLSLPPRSRRVVSFCCATAVSFDLASFLLSGYRAWVTVQKRPGRSDWNRRGGKGIRCCYGVRVIRSYEYLIIVTPPDMLIGGGVPMMYSFVCTIYTVLQVIFFGTPLQPMCMADSSIEHENVSGIVLPSSCFGKYPEVGGNTFRLFSLLSKRYKYVHTWYIEKKIYIQ